MVKRGQPGYCSICIDPVRKAFVDEARALGRGAYSIQSMSRQPYAEDLGISPMKEETVRRHFLHDGGAPSLRPVPNDIRQGYRRKTVPKTTVRVLRASPEEDETEVSPPPVEHVDPVWTGTGEVTFVPPSSVVPLPEGDEDPKHANAKDVASLVVTKAMEGIEDGSLRVTTAHGLQAQGMLDRREERKKDRELSVQLARLLSGSMRVPAHLVIDGTARDVTDEEVSPAMLSEHA
jgi:hypothetical protein